MTRLNLLLAATTSTLLLLTGSVRATETALDGASDGDGSATGLTATSTPIAATEPTEPTKPTGSFGLDAIAQPDLGLVLEKVDGIDRARRLDAIAAERTDPQPGTVDLAAEPAIAAAPLPEPPDEPATESTSRDGSIEATIATDVESVTGEAESGAAEPREATSATDPDANSDINRIDRAEPEAVDGRAEPDLIRLDSPIAADPLRGDGADRPVLHQLLAQGDIQLTFDNDAPPPHYLNPHPSPLHFPNLETDVEIIGLEAISLNQAIELALRNNIDLQNSIISVQRQQQTLRSNLAALWPQLDLTSSFTWSDSANARISIQRQIDITGSQSALQTDSTSTSWNTELRLRYNIFTGGSRDANIRSARERLRLLELDVERLTETTRLSVSEAYYDIQNADQSVIIAQSAVENSKTSLSDAQALESAGVGTQFDVLRAEVQLANDQQQLRQAESDQQVARRTLARLLDVSGNWDVSASDPVELAGTWDLPLEETIILALRSRAELEQQIAQREIARQEQRAARASSLPQLSTFAAVNLLDNSEDGVGLTEGYAAGVQLSWQLFNGGQTRAAMRDQELAQASAELEFANQRGQVRLQVEQSYYQLGASLQNVSTAENALELAEESLQLARLRFQAGVGTQTEVIDAQNDLTQAQGNRVTAIIGYNRALANLRRSVSNYPFTDEVDRAF